MMQVKDPLDSMLLSFPELKAPKGFAQRLQARLSEETQPRPEQFNLFQISGALCIAGAAVMFIMMNTPVLGLIPQIIQALGGSIQ